MLMKKKSLSNTWVDETITYYFLEKVNINKVKWNFKRSRWPLVGGSWSVGGINWRINENVNEKLIRDIFYDQRFLIQRSGHTLW